MEALLAVLRALRLALDLLLLVLDLNFLVVSSAVSAVLWLLGAAARLPAAALWGWDALWRWLWRGAAEGAAPWARRGLGAALRGGQALGRQAGEALGIASSLLLYLANSLLNAVLLGAQNLLTLLAALGDALALPALRAAELVAAGLAHVASAAIALSILLWSPCQLAVELLCAAAQGFVSVFFVNIYGLGLLLLIVAAGAVALNPALLWVPARQLLRGLHGLPAAQRLPRDAWRLYQAAVLSVGMAAASQPWRRLAEWALQVADWSLQVTNWGLQVTNWGLQVTNWSRGGRAANRGSGQREAVAVPRALAPGRAMLGRLLGEDEEPLVQPRAGSHAGTAHGRAMLGRLLDEDEEPLVQPRAGTAHGRVAMGRLLDEDEEQGDVGQVPLPRPALSRATAGQRPQHDSEEPGTSWGKAARKQQLNAAAGSAEASPDDDPWVLLKEQEERKKCVICQDQTKTVLLLPCRHLCLCQECTEVLLQQAIYQRNCPLCRQMILQTLNVYL